MKAHTFSPRKVDGKICLECGAGADHPVHALTEDPTEQDNSARDALAATYKKNAVMPSHYRRMKIEPLTFAVENGLNPFQTKVVKYVCRAEHKNGIEDLMKAKRVIEMYIKKLEGDPAWWEAPKDAP